MAIFALGIGLVVSVLNIYFRDVGQLVEILLQFLFWFTPIVYFPSMLSRSQGGFMHFTARLLQWNPLAHFVQLGQWLAGSGEAAFSGISLAVVLLAPIVSMALGLALFNHFKQDILDNI